MDGVATIRVEGFAPRTLLVTGRSRVLAGLLFLLILRVVYLLVCPLELVPDEAYYWDWSRQLDWGYYSKPPMIAWLIALATAIGGDSEFAIRVPAALLGTLGLWFVYELGRRMYSHRAGVLAMLVVAVSPGAMALCLLMTIDAPFLAAWGAAVYCLWRMLERDRTDVRWLAPAIIATGAGLLSKQSALGLFPLAMLFLATGTRDRRKLQEFPFWIWLAGSAAWLLPVVWWNFQHDWVTLEHTREHFAPRSVSIMRHLALFAEFAATQFGILSPVVCGLLLVVSAVLLRRFSSLPRRERFLICFGALPMVAVGAMALFQRVQANWPVPLHLTGVILLSAWSCGEVSLSDRLDRLRNWLPAGLVVGGIFSSMLAVSPFVLSASPLAGTGLDPTGRLRGWRELGHQVGGKWNSFPDADQVLIVAATARGPVSELAYYLPGKPRVYRWNVGEAVDSQHDVWGGPANGHGRDALILTDDNLPVPPRLASAFLTVDGLGPVAVSLGGDSVRRYRVWHGCGLRAWPVRKPFQSSLATDAQID